MGAFGIPASATSPPEDGAPFVARRAMNLHGCALPHSAPPPTSTPPDHPVSPYMLSTLYVTVILKGSVYLSIPLPFVDDLLLGLLHLGGGDEPDLAPQAGDRAGRFDDAGYKRVRRGGGIFKDDLHLHIVVVIGPGDDKLRGGDLGDLPRQLGDLLGVDEHALDLRDLVDAADQFQQPGGSAPAGARVVGES